MKRRVVVTVAVVAAVLLGGGGLAWLVAAHSGGGSSAGSSSPSAGRAMGVASGNDSVSSADSAAKDPGAAGTTDPGTMTASAGLATRDVVQTAQLTLTASDPSDVARRADDIADAAGGHVDQDDRSSAAHLVLRVPDAALGTVLDRLAGLGHETGRQVHGADVTAQTADLGARVAALQTSVTRLQQLMGTSGSLDALLQVESQLTQRQADLESLQAQQRALADQVAFATVTVDVTTPAAAARAAAPTGFGHAVAAGWHGFVLALRFIVAGLGYSLPTLTALGLVAAAVVLVRRRRRRGHGPVEQLPSA